MQKLPSLIFLDKIAGTFFLDQNNLFPFEIQQECWWEGSDHGDKGSQTCFSCENTQTDFYSVLLSF